MHPSLVAALLCLASCAAQERPRPYAATVVEVFQPRGALMNQYFRPNGGTQAGPLTVIRLRIGGNGSGSGRLVEIDHVGAYEPALMGAAGDRVAFSYQGPLPARGGINEGSVLSYQVLR